MKQTHHFNLFIVGLPIILGLLGLINEMFLFYSLLSTILTGLVQVIFGINMLIEEPRNKKLQLYIGSVTIYFLIWYLIADNNFDNEEIYYFLFSIPILLAIFLTYIIYKKTKS